MKVLTIIKSDFKIIFRDRSLAFLIFLPLLFWALLRFAPPIYEQYLPALREYRAYFLSVFCILSAVILGFILHALIGPESIGSIPGLDLIKDIALYGSLLLVGVSFQDISDLHPRNPFSESIYKVSFVRFAVAPVLGFLPILFIQLEPLIAIPLLIQSMAPPAVSNIIYGTFFDMNESLISKIITVVTLLALIVLPFELLVFLTLFPLT